ncbi:MAG: response regulator transcription factor [Candidatus Pacebacteria bacterium]|nr:response regulator transcription factor [Candidatus Paceibacterota bacterium]
MKILLVEDNAKLNEAIRTYLDENGFEVDVAFNGVQGISKVKELKKKEEEYDVIILDRMMPLKDGIEVLRDIKDISISSGIIMLTAKDTIDDKIFGLAEGADDYMVKPFNVKELIARIHSLYRRNLIKNELPKNFLSKDKSFSDDEMKENNIQNKRENKKYNFIFDINKSEIFLEDTKKTICLTNKEANIFEILLENQHDSVSKDFILEKIWKESEKPSSRFVDVHVHNLRNKLIKDKFSGRIETIRSAGYKLILE